MEGKLLIQYILFSFSPDASGPAAEVIAALILKPIEEPSRFEVYTRPNWGKNYQSDEMFQLANDILEEWRNIDRAEAESIFNSVIDASLSPLRAVTNGSCDEVELKKILETELSLKI